MAAPSGGCACAARRGAVAKGRAVNTALWGLAVWGATFELHLYGPTLGAGTAMG